jgi:hypothetical protein
MTHGQGRAPPGSPRDLRIPPLAAPRRPSRAVADVSIAIAITADDQRAMTSRQVCFQCLNPACRRNQSQCVRIGDVVRCERCGERQPGPAMILKLLAWAVSASSSAARSRGVASVIATTGSTPARRRLRGVPNLGGRAEPSVHMPNVLPGSLAAAQPTIPPPHRLPSGQARPGDPKVLRGPASAPTRLTQGLGDYHQSDPPGPKG